MNVIFGSVIYPAAVQYASAFLKSLERQSYKSFSLFLINDGVPENVLVTIMEQYDNNFEIVSYQEEYSPVELRIKLISEAIHRKADYLIFGDIDDYFSENRVERTINQFSKLKGIGFCYNEIVLEDGRSCMPTLPLIVNTIDDIRQRNFLGLSNTSIKLESINENFAESLFECKTYVFDWYLFSRLILNGVYGCYVPGTFTFYRQHDNNYVGVTQMNSEAVEKEIIIKKYHYEILSKYDAGFGELVKAYERGEYEIIKQDKYYWWNLTRRMQK